MKLLTYKDFVPFLGPLWW